METAMTVHESRTGMRQTRCWAILATMLLGTTLAILDSSILNVLVVPIMETFQADLRTVKWALTSYNFVLAMFMIGFGSLGDTAGRRRLYVLGQVVFVGGSVLAAVAGELWQLIASRALHGLEGFHRALVEAVHGGFAQVFGLAALLAGIGVVAGLLVPRRLGGRPDES